MGEVIEETDEPIPLKCCVCDVVIDGDGGHTFEVIEDGETLDEDDWYLHIDGAEEIDGDRLVNPEVYAFCPECAPDEALPVDEPDFDIEEYVN